MLADTRQFLSTDVQSMLNDNQFTLVASNQIHQHEYSDFKIIKFSLLHAKNIRNDYGLPIWLSTHDAVHQPIPFDHSLHLQAFFILYLPQLWSKHSLRLDTDPFLSFRVGSKLMCMLYSDIQTAVKSSAAHTEAWFNTQSIRMTIARGRLCWNNFFVCSKIFL